MDDILLFNSQQAREYLGLSKITFERYITNPDIPLQGKLLTKRARMFTKEELDAFLEFKKAHPELGKRGRPEEPDAPYHGRHKKVYINTQRIADGIKAHVLKAANRRRKEAINAIGHFEGLAWYPAAFKEACPLFEVQEDGSVIYTGEANELCKNVIESLQNYEKLIVGE